MAGTVIIYDFDKTIIDCDSDNWVIDELGASQLFNALLPTMPWNSLMDFMMKKLHDQGITIDDIVEVLKRAPLDHHIASAIKFAFALGCDLRIVSDANQFFIETILKHHGLMGCFTEINTNPSHVDGEGRLRISSYHDLFSHGCASPTCPPNMCKGKIVEGIVAEERRRRAIYLGDGKGDYCASLRLREGDIVMARRGYPLWDLIQGGNEGFVRATVQGWSDGEEQERALQRVIAAESELRFSADCKMGSMPGHESPLPKALQVPL